MTEDEKQAIRASFANKKVSQMTELERKVFDEDFQYGIANRGSSKSVTDANSKKSKSRFSSVLRRLGLTKS